MPTPAESGTEAHRPWQDTSLEVLGDSDFIGGRLRRPGLYVVCFAAEWCPVTRRFLPRLLARKDSLAGSLAIADITSLESPLWDEFRIRITPSIIVFDGGEVRHRVDGVRFLGITSGALERLARDLAESGSPAPSDPRGAK